MGGNPATPRRAGSGSMDLPTARMLGDDDGSTGKDPRQSSPEAGVPKPAVNDFRPTSQANEPRKGDKLSDPGPGAEIDNSDTRPTERLDVSRHVNDGSDRNIVPTFGETQRQVRELVLRAGAPESRDNEEDAASLMSELHRVDDIGSRSARQRCDRDG